MDERMRVYRVLGTASCYVAADIEASSPEEALRIAREDRSAMWKIGGMDDAEIKANRIDVWDDTLEIEEESDG